MKVLFRDKLKSYSFVVALGLLAGLTVVFFIEVPDNGFWSFYYWSSSTFGFWMFSTSLIVLFVDCFIQREQKMRGNQCGNLHIPDVPYYDHTPILPTLPQRSDAAGVIIQTDTESYRRLAAIQRSARFCMCRVGNNPMVRQKKYNMRKTAPCNAGGIFVCGNEHSFLQCFCLSRKIFFGIKRSYLLTGIFGYFF